LISRSSSHHQPALSRYFADFGHPEIDQHPPSVVTLGEQLIAAGKSPFAQDYVVGLGGLELLTKRLSAACSEH